MWHRVMCVLAVCFFSAGVAIADNKSVNDAKKGLEGTWQTVDGEGNGKKLPTDQVEELRIVIKGDQLDIKPDGEGRRTTFQVDPSKTPKTIDLIPHDGSRKGSIVPGIYSLQDEQLRLCINIWGKDPALRPTEFKAQEGDGCVFVTLRRTKQE